MDVWERREESNYKDASFKKLERKGQGLRLVIPCLPSSLFRIEDCKLTLSVRPHVLLLVRYESWLNVRLRLLRRTLVPAHNIYPLSEFPTGGGGVMNLRSSRWASAFLSSKRSQVIFGFDIFSEAPQRNLTNKHKDISHLKGMFSSNPDIFFVQSGKICFFFNLIFFRCIQFLKHICDFSPLKYMNKYCMHLNAVKV